ncbi:MULTISPECIES: nitrite reductase small subunit NirD [Commensalibacter]|uniref:Nitrite reductase (NADH) small subunit n=2 Tax=Commensalibacter TaxID=1079922 RepID=W7DZX3_9PROT|nr:MULTISPECIES: nitrite reductase small subunit NirD [Commensalibacter]EUK18219.1 nitrite reductase small subunit [Commensalibacter papalotli (ex Servin-Garciduenas et al. 2014)]CAI3937480.1 Ferredoxin subunit of nitrite reductase or a ring-hydroxylating dioxygenase (NirD) (PDB:1FQT) (PUBMED:23844911) [Commensalibacter papalotli (ex Botero et al. 2024)]CAI3938145.1 Ferredoxin subunit of nitrite reductase or a ring-hydroxylating dioxygenase (NirD) (PDB:1FQT) (PUBMED:23844911) [Commensalibacter p
MSEWITICQINDLIPQTGICALVKNEHVAIFRPTENKELYAISNIDPFAKASVLSRGLIGEHKGDLWVASPLKKQRFRLKDGVCLEDVAYNIKAYDVRVSNDSVEIRVD